MMRFPVSPAEIARAGLCIGCGCCVEAGVRMQLDDRGQYQPSGPPDWANRPSDRFARTCPFSSAASNEDELASQLYPHAPHQHPAIGRFRCAFAGYVRERGFRQDGSSGGLVSWVLAELLRRRWIDGAAHVVPVADPRREQRFFRYAISRSEAAIRAGAKSRYYPVELSEVLAAVRATPGRYAVVGIPCFIKAIHLLRREDSVLRERIAFTLGLFCGHMKSARFLESFAWQLGIRLEEVASVDFRLKDQRRAANWYTVQFVLRNGRCMQKDWWSLADGDWGAGFFQNSACNFCDDVVAETADISFGDAWVEPYSSDGRGTNVVIVRSAALGNLIAAGIRESRLKLDPIDAEFIRQTQAAGFRQRREGLAYRLTWAGAGHRLRKRVEPAASLPWRRKLVYRMRAAIAAGSHRVFGMARMLHWRGLYLGWARLMMEVYHALAYGRGRLGIFLKRVGLRSQRHNSAR